MQLRSHCPDAKFDCPPSPLATVVLASRQSAGNKSAQRNRHLQLVWVATLTKSCGGCATQIHVFGFEEVAPMAIGRTQVRYRYVTQATSPPPLAVRPALQVCSGGINGHASDTRYGGCMHSCAIGSEPHVTQADMPAARRSWLLLLQAGGVRACRSYHHPHHGLQGN